MRILLWPTCYRPNIGGLETQVHALAKQLQANGHEVLVISDQVRKLTIEAFVIEGVEVICLPFERALITYNVPLIKVIMDRVSLAVKQFKPDIVHVHGWMEAFCFYQKRILAQYSLPMILTVHGLFESSFYGKSAWNIWRKANVVTTVSHFMRLQIEAEICPTVSRAVRLIDNGLPQVPKPLQPLPEDFRIFMAGRLVVDKGFDVALQAMAVLHQRYPQLRLRLAGIGREMPTLQALRVELGLEACVDMLGFVSAEEMPNEIDQASIVIVPSVYEPFGLIALEALMRGRPVIASQVGGLPEIVEEGVTGLLVPASDPRAIVAAVESVLHSPSRLQEMSTNAVRCARERFSIERTTQEYEALYEELLCLQPTP